MVTLHEQPNIGQLQFSMLSTMVPPDDPRTIPDEVAQLRAELAHLRDVIRRQESFVAVVTHELRNPIAPVLLSLEALLLEVTTRSGPIDRDLLVRRLQSTRRYALRLRADLDRLLDYSRVRSGRLDLRLEPADLSAIVAACVDDMRPMIEAAQCELQLSLQPRLRGRWDRMRTNQIVWNLVSNAVKYAAGSRIDVRTSGTDDHVTLVVADTGPGIPETDQEQVFAKFERVEAGAQHTGFGIGLWLVRSTVQAMGGTVTLESQVGAGTTFTIRLPRGGP